eukprot:TRINITY_DN34471_c2_g2_i1.p1 TRINITY_DN34471_c2_g2~~TRINITY_DN34471_c2_g2_i1.p1  ORF type:complete len:283 (+),score=63.28 TRINITY_DN34471_c2_g2_i1:2-850(+)
MMSRLQPYDVTSVLWSFAILELWDADVWRAGNERLKYFEAHKLSEQVYGALFHIGLVQKACHQQQLQIPKEMAIKVYEYKRQSTIKPLVSGFQMEVDRLLSQLGFQTISEHGVLQDYIAVDIAISVDDRKIAVEADGPFHYSVNAPYVQLRTSFIRNKILESFGWEVVVIPFYEWDQFEQRGDKKLYLMSKIMGDEEVQEQVDQHSEKTGVSDEQDKEFEEEDNVKDEGQAQGEDGELDGGFVESEVQQSVVSKDISENIDFQSIDDNFIPDDPEEEQQVGS